IFIPDISPCDVLTNRDGDRDENFALVDRIVVVLVLVVVLGLDFEDEHATTSTMCREINVQSQLDRYARRNGNFCSSFLNSRPSPGSLLKAPMLSPPVRAEREKTGNEAANPGFRWRSTLGY